jgi:glycerol-3-phosphate dehydrogenase
MRARDLDRLTAAPYDVLVIGGGITGLTIAYEASSRGLRTALVEAGDLGGGTSFNHQKTAHGGLRALQGGRLDRAIDGIHERRALARIAPWFLRPLPFLIGTYRSLGRSRLALRAAFGIDRTLGRRRNDGVEPELHLPRPRLISRAATLRLFPGIRQEGLTGGAQWYDYQMVEADRLTLAFAAAADRAGADLATYAEATAAVRTRGRVTGMEIRDRLGDRTLTIDARVTINAAGARAAEIMAMFGDPRPVPMLKAMNLVTTARISDMALAAPTASGRMLTLVPWRGRAIVGTSQSPVLPAGARPVVSAAEVDAFIAEANEAFPALKLTPAHVSLVHRGIVPATLDRRGSAVLRSEAPLFDHKSAGAPGAFSVLGLKYTSARGVAEKTIDAVARRAGLRVARSETATRTLPGAGIADHEALAIETARALHVEVPATMLARLTATYADNARAIVALMSEREEYRRTVAPGFDVTGAEVVHAIRHEMALRLPDIVIRRSGLGAAGHPGAAVVAGIAGVAATELGWPDARMREEIDAVDAFYAISP